MRLPFDRFNVPRPTRFNHVFQGLKKEDLEGVVKGELLKWGEVDGFDELWVADMGEDAGSGESESGCQCHHANMGTRKEKMDQWDEEDRMLEDVQRCLEGVLREVAESSEAVGVVGEQPVSSQMDTDHDESFRALEVELQAFLSPSAFVPSNDQDSIQNAHHKAPSTPKKLEKKASLIYFNNYLKRLRPFTYFLNILPGKWTGFYATPAILVDHPRNCDGPMQCELRWSSSDLELLQAGAKYESQYPYIPSEENKVYLPGMKRPPPRPPLRPILQFHGEGRDSVGEFKMEGRMVLGNQKVFIRKSYDTLGFGWNYEGCLLDAAMSGVWGEWDGVFSMWKD
jgi:hypothetical protein